MSAEGTNEEVVDMKASVEYLRNDRRRLAELNTKLLLRVKELEHEVEILEDWCDSLNGKYE